MKIDISSDINDVTVKVIKMEDQHYTSTHVSGGGTRTTYNSYGASYVTTAPVSTTVTHHQVQKVWFENEDGTEGSVTLKDMDIDVREENEARIVSSKKTGRMLRFKNNSTGYYWRVRGYAVPRSFAGKLFSGIGNRIKAFFSALFSSLPIVNVFIGLGMIFGGRGNDFRYEKSKTRFHRLVFLALLVVMGLTVYVFEDGRWRGKIPEWSVTLTPGDQVPLLRAWGNLYLHTAKAFNLTDDREELEIKRSLAMSDDELIRITPLQNKKIWLLDPTRKEGYLGAYLVFTGLGFLVLYLHRRRIQKINDRINVQLDAMM